MAKRKNQLTSEALKQNLWETLIAVRRKKMDPIVANSVASASREIMRIVNAEIRIAEMTGATINGFLGTKENKKLAGKTK